MWRLSARCCRLNVGFRSLRGWLSYVGLFCRRRDSKAASGQAGALHFGGRRGTADCAAVLALGSRRRTHCAHCVRFVQTTAASQILMRASAPTPVLRSSPPKRRAPTCPHAALRQRWLCSAEETRTKTATQRALVSANQGRPQTMRSTARWVVMARGLWRRGAQTWFAKQRALVFAFIGKPRTVPSAAGRACGVRFLWRRGAQGWGRREAPQYLTRRGCLSAMSAANAASSAARPQSEHRSEVGVPADRHSMSTPQARPAALLSNLAIRDLNERPQRAEIRHIRPTQAGQIPPKWPRGGRRIRRTRARSRRWPWRRA
jgi:hypothetical protein